MPVFKLTNSQGAALRGGATRTDGLGKLEALSAQEALGLLEGLKVNLRGADGVPKHGVLKLRNSSNAGKTMEFARMRGLDRMMSSRDTFANTAKAIQMLMVRSGLSEEKASELLQQYRSDDGSIKYKHALEMINGALDIIKAQPPRVFSGATAQEALSKAGIEIQGDRAQLATADKFTLDAKDKRQGVNAGAYGEVFEAVDNGNPCVFKRLGQPINVERNRDGELPRGRGMDGNHLAAGKLPGVIGPNRYVLRQRTKLPNSTDQVTFHVVNAGREFKQFCKAFFKDHPNEAESSLFVHGLIMDKAPGTLLRKAELSDQQLRGVAQGFAAVLINTAAHGVVLGDIKPENAFVDGDKLTLIDTDGAFKQSKWASKSAEKVSLARTFKVPGRGNAGLQQDLWSTGFTLLEAAHPDLNNELVTLAKPPEVVQQQRLSAVLDGDGPARPPAAPKVNSGQIMAKLQEIVGRPPPGSVDEFAFLCIQQALSQTQSAYTQRFTGQGRHLLDPLLAHPVVGGRDAFVAQHLVKKAALPQKPAAVATEGSAIKPLIEDKEIDLFAVPAQQPKKEKQLKDDEDDLPNSELQKFLMGQLKFMKSPKNGQADQISEELSDDE